MSKRPPVFTEGMDYDQWKKDVTLWTLVSEFDETKHGVVVHLSLTGRARNATSEISQKDISGKDGMKHIFAKLDRVYLQDETWKCFHTYLNFENYKRPKNCSIDEYLSEFDLRLHKLKECKVELQDTVVACRLLKSCDISDVSFQLALSTCSVLTFENMRATLKKLFAENEHLLTSGKGTDDSNVKVDNDALFNNSYRGRGTSRRGGGRFDGGGFDGGRFDSGRFDG